MPRKKQYEIVNNSRDEVRTLDVDGRKVQLGGNGLSLVHDPGLAKEIDARYGYKSKEKHGGSVVVVEVDDRDRAASDRSYARSWVVPDLSRLKKKES